MNRINKKGFEFSFGWIFAIIVGAAILFLAIYGVTKIAGGERKVQESETAKELGALLSPLETALEEGKIAKATFSTETRINNDCVNIGTFGEQRISVSSKSSIGEEWTSGGVASKYPNKYLFSSKVIEGKSISILSKPFDMPFKVADLMFIWSDKEKYCFVNPIEEIEEEMTNLKPEGISIVSSISDCPANTIKVCFGGGGNCNVVVDTNSKSVIRGANAMYYEGALVYGAIFSSSDLYECQVKRIVKRTAELIKIYKLKSQKLVSFGCSSNLDSQLDDIDNLIKNFEDSENLAGIYSSAEQLNERNEKLECKLF